jgi:hypothetical protein
MTTQERLKELLSYDPETGVFTRLVGRSGPNARAGDVAGCNNGQGYVRIYVDGKPYKAHRLAWFYTHGVWPSEMDHKNGNRSDNRIANLREVTRAENKANSSAYKNNTSGYVGVSLHKKSGQWIAQIQKDGKKQGLGYFPTPEVARAAYVEAAQRLFGEFMRAS